MQKIVVVGSTGSGKTMFAQALSKKMSIPHVELDRLHWLHQGQRRQQEEFKDLVTKAADTPRWVICGNYPSLQDITVGKADVVVWLDYPFRVCFWQTLKRSLKRIINHEDYCNGNRETLRMLLSKNSILRWQITTFRKRNKRYAQLMQDPLYKNKTFVRLTSRTQARRWLQSIQ